DHARQSWADLRLPRPERFRQNHDHPDAVRTAYAGFRARTMTRIRHSDRKPADQAACRLHDAALQPLSGPLDSGEPRIRGARLRAGQPDGSGARSDRATWPGRSRGSARGRTLWRMEAATGARRLHPAWTRSAVAR